MKFPTRFLRRSDRDAAPAFRGIAGFAREGRLILASASPQRRRILSLTGLPFRVDAPDVDEAPWHERMERALRSPDPFRTAFRAALHGLTAAKGQAVRRPDAVVLAFDTVVFRGARLLPKPVDEDEARRGLRDLLGAWHSVWTACRAEGPGFRRIALHRARVRFRELDEEALEAHVARGEWRGAAGGYRIQETGLALVDRLRGDFHTVMGLPLAFLLEIMRARVAGEAKEDST